jgi:benzoate membrane transport protein
VKRFFSDVGGVYAANALVGFIFAATGPVAIVLAIGTMGGLSQADIASWIFGSFFLNGLISISFSLHYRQPLVFFWTIPGSVLVGPALGHLSFPEVIGAFIATGVLMLALGLSGWVRRFTEAAPMPIVMAMVAGVFLRFGIGIVTAVRDDVLIAGSMVLAFLFLSWSALGKRLPPVLGAMLTGALALFLLDSFDLKSVDSLRLTLPNVYTPVFSWQAMVELVVPLAITVLVVQNGQGFAVLTAAGHKPPMNAIAAACGVGSIVSGLTGAASSCLTGPVNAIISSGGEKHRHYTAGVMVGLLALLFGMLSTSFTQLLLATPPAFIAALGGLAMLRVLQTAFSVAFSGKFGLGALVTFLVTVADVPIFNVGAAFWGLVFGFAVSWLLESKDFGR